MMNQNQHGMIQVPLLVMDCVYRLSVENEISAHSTRHRVRMASERERKTAVADKQFNARLFDSL